ISPGGAAGNSRGREPTDRTQQFAVEPRRGDRGARSVMTTRTARFALKTRLTAALVLPLLTACNPKKYQSDSFALPVSTDFAPAALDTIPVPGRAIHAWMIKDAGSAVAFTTIPNP